MYDVVIIGAGPGGIYSAYELIKLNKGLKIVVLEEGNPLEKRKCPIDGKKVKSCINWQNLCNYERFWRSWCIFGWKI